MTREIILHIGTSKTGTSSLHYAFHKLANSLEQQGILYPNLDVGGFNWVTERGASSGNMDVNYPNFDWGTEDRMERFGLLLKKVNALTTNVNKILLSSENLSFLAVERDFWEELAKASLQSESKFRVVAYLRDPFDFFLTCYKQCVKSGGFVGSLDEYVEVFLKAKIPVSFRFQGQIKRVIEASKEFSINLDLYRYENALPVIEGHFFENVLGAKQLLDQIQITSNNSSMNVLETEFHRGINSVAPRMAQLLGWERTDNIFSKQVERNLARDEKFVLTPDARSRLTNAFENYAYQISGHHGLASEIDFRLLDDNVVLGLDDSQKEMRKQIFELGRFVAFSWRHGFLRQELNRSKPNLNSTQKQKMDDHS